MNSDHGSCILMDKKCKNIEKLTIIKKTITINLIKYEKMGLVLYASVVNTGSGQQLRNHCRRFTAHLQDLAEN